ncbi:MAG: thioredoxin domain-containing protein [Thermoleophilia bacterium]
MANLLKNEPSPYLQQHADNPVDWRPWGPEAFAQAKAEDKPVFLSIGYAACHWCHVMAEESFEDDETAAYLNEHFVSIKVDREERPDLDDLYMQAVTAMTGRGGWPLSVWLTPEGSPFLGGTYFPDRPRMGMPSFRQVLEFVASKWSKERSRILETAEDIQRHLVEENQLPFAEDRQKISATLSDEATATLSTYFDENYGGWGRAPKFPQAMVADFLLHRFVRTGDERGLEMAQAGLDAMGRGGIYDQLGGGFHRYSVGARWRVPHFEKMLYDNALLARAYLHAFLLTGQKDYERIVRETLDYVLREMVDPEGGFYSSQDADSEGTEGKFFVWTLSAFESALRPEFTSGEVELVKSHFGVTAEGNFEGANVLYQAETEEEVAARYGLDTDKVRETLMRARRVLFTKRSRRTKPARDEKVLTGWNGLMLAALAEAGRYLAREDYLSAAQKNARFLLEHLRRDDGRLLRSWRSGRASINGFLEDHAALAEGLLSLYQADFDEHWFLAARETGGQIMKHFGAPEGGFFDTSDDHEQLLARPRSLTDNALPAGGSLAATVLLRLYALSGEGSFRDAAEGALRSAVGLMESQPVLAGQWLIALEQTLAPQVQVALVGPRAGDAINRYLETVNTGFRPFLTVAARGPGQNSAVPLLAGREPGEAEAAAWVCRSGACSPALTSSEELAAAL